MAPAGFRTAESLAFPWRRVFNLPNPVFAGR
jgi:hypothetical protein